MSKKKCMIYKVSTTRSSINRNISKLCHRILETNCSVTDELRKLCGSICHASLFLIPDYELADNQRYTIENVCYYVPGLLKQSWHEILDNLSSLAYGDKEVTKLLANVLHDCTFAEALSLITTSSGEKIISTKEIYAALYVAYLYVANRLDLFDTIKTMYTNSDIITVDLWYHFERNIMNV